MGDGQRWAAEQQEQEDRCALTAKHIETAYTDEISQTVRHLKSSTIEKWLAALAKETFERKKAEALARIPEEDRKLLGL